MIWLIDISNYQTGLDIDQAGREGYSAVICKATEGVSYRDPRFDTFIPQVKAAGLIPGAYHFLRASDGAAQARAFHARVAAQGGPGGFLCACDNEQDATWDVTREFYAEWARLTGGHPLMMYSGAWWWSPRGWPGASLTPYLWASHYVSGSGAGSALYAKVPASWWTPGYGGWNTATILQFSSSATVADQAVDVNAYRGTIAQLRELTSASGAIIPSTQGDDMQSFMRWTGSNAVVLSDGITARWVRSEGEMADIRTLAAEGTISLGYDGGVRIVGNRDLCGQIVGERPAEWGDNPIVGVIEDAMARVATVQMDDAAIAAIAAAVVARPEVPLGDADKPAIVAAVQEAIRSLVGA
jgi:lysozyme